MPTSTLDRGHPLVVTGDPVLLDDLLRLAAAGSSEVWVAPDAVAARERWVAAPFVLLGVDAVTDVIRISLPRRAAVVVVARGESPPPSWPVTEALRVEHIVLLPDAETWLVDRFADQALGNPNRARVVAVLGGRGGAGASVLATALAVTGRRRGLDTLLVDADPLGGGVDLVMGWERMQGLRWPALVDACGRVSPPALVGALPGEGSLAVLSFDRSTLDSVPAEAMSAALDAGRRGRDLVVIDVPRTLDEPSALALSAADRAYLVVPADLRACSAARQVVTAVAHHCAVIAAVVRTSGSGDLDPAEVARVLEVPLAGTLRNEPRVLRALASGDPPGASGRGPLAELCQLLLHDLSPRRHRAGTR